MHGLVICDKWPQVPVPLEKFDAHAVLINNNAEVSCEFTYKNSTPDIIETEFAFPLESTAAVYHLEAIIGSKRLVANCRERIEAEGTYGEAVEAGHTAFMMQEDYTMGDTFRMKLGNIPAGETIKLTFKYVVPLYLREVDRTVERFEGLQEAFVLVFSMPLKLGGRYDPNPGAHERSAAPQAPAKMSFRADIHASGGIASVTSAHQKFQVKYVDETKEHAEVSVSDGLDLSHDFELEVALLKPHVLSAPCELGCTSKGGFLGMHCVTATFLPNIPHSQASDGDKRELIFVIDRSGSMSGSKMQKTKESLLLFLKSLPKKCRFQIVGFGSTFQPLFPQPVEYNKENVERALEYQKSMSADMGGTEVLAALRSVYATPVTGAGWYKYIVFLTDGEILNQDEVIGLVTRNQTSARLFAIGLGEEVSTSLIWGVARAGRGTAAFIRSEDNLRATTMSVLRSALQPMLRDVELKWDVKVDGKAADILTIPSQLPPLFSGVFLTAFSLIEAGESKCPRVEGTLKLSYKLEDKTHSQEAGVHCLPVEDENLGLHRLAAKAQLLELVDQHSALQGGGGDKVDEGAKSEIRQQIVDISTNTNVISPFTSFVGVDPDKIVKDTKMWATALVVAYLRTHMASRKEEWEMVVQKAVDWLKATCPDPEALIEKAKKALEKLVPKP
ncbi:von Willebrand factor A domain-containing protein 5A [Taenia solium]